MSLLINLLPWREEQRRQKQQQVYIFLGASVLLTLLALTLAQWYLKHDLRQYAKRHNYLQMQLSVLKIEKNYSQQLIQYENILNDLRFIKKNLSKTHVLLLTLQKIGEAMPVDLQLNLLSKNSDQWILQGSAAQTKSVTQFTNNLIHCHAFSKIKLNNLKNDASSSKTNFIIYVPIHTKI